MHLLVGFDDASLAMYPLVGPAPHAQRCVNKERRFLAMHLLVFSRAPGPLPPEDLRRVFSFSFLLEFLLKNVRFGRSLAQLILAALSIYPFGFKEGPGRRFLSDVPFGRFRFPGPKVRQ